MALLNVGNEDHVAAVREFNRFYTARLGLLRRRHLDGEFSLTEARMLYEIAAGPGLTASALRKTLGLDAGYVSRSLALLKRRKLVRQASSKHDGREKPLSLTSAGSRAVAWLNEQSGLQIRELLAGADASERAALIDALSTIQLVLGGHQEQVRIVRLTTSNDEVLGLLQEYYEAIDVVQRDSPEAVQATIDAPDSGVWLAYKGNAAVGCVALRRLSSIPGATECKRLYVQPVARGSGIADKLLAAQEDYARSQGLRWIYRDSYADLKAAIALYQKRGYDPCERYNDNPQATIFLRKRIAPDS